MIQNVSQHLKIGANLLVTFLDVRVTNKTKIICDRILVIDNGKLSEISAHSSVLLFRILNSVYCKKKSSLKKIREIKSLVIANGLFNEVSL